MTFSAGYVGYTQVSLRGVLSFFRVDTCPFLASNEQKEIEEARVYMCTKDISVISLFLVHRVGNCAVVFGPGQLIWVPKGERLTL